jgi:hypothetical protein
MMLQHVVRHTRLGDEAKARMAAKFGNNAAGSMGGVGPSSGSRPPAPSPCPGNSSFGLASNSSNPGAIRSAPTSGNAPAIRRCSNLGTPMFELRNAAIRA